MLPTEAPTRVPWQDPGKFVQVRTDFDVSPYHNPPEGPLVPGPFAILHRGIALARPNGRGLVLHGDVAKLSSGALRCRYPTKGIDGNIVTYDRWHPEDRIERVSRPHGYDWAFWAKSKRQTITTPWELTPRAEPTDIVKFRRESPNVARLLGIDVAPVVTRVFPIGTVFVSGGFGPEFWHSFLDRHASEADFGANGQFADSAPLNEESFWTLSDASILVQNAAAIQSQSGPIRSRYRLEGEYEKMCKRRDMVNCVNLTTVLSRSSSTTLGWCEEFHSEQHPF